VRCSLSSRAGGSACDSLGALAHTRMRSCTAQPPPPTPSLSSLLPFLCLHPPP
jgi:hypothetical protein